MIKPDRLKELIEQEAIIYDIFKCDIYAIDLKVAEYYDVPDYIEYINNYYQCRLTRNCDDLFETKEEAEWYLEFCNITREEKLVLPSWAEFKENCNFPTIHCKNGKTANFTVSNSYLEIYKDSDDGYCEKKIYGKPLTKENYIDACRLCKQLFLGEEE